MEDKDDKGGPRKGMVEDGLALLLYRHSDTRESAATSRKDLFDLVRGGVF